MSVVAGNPAVPLKGGVSIIEKYKMTQLDLTNVGQLKPESSWAPAELRGIRSRLDEYYRSVSDYTAFLAPSEQDHCWTHIGTEIRSRLAGASQELKVLEIGAGKSGFGLWLDHQGLRHSVCWSAQDVTQQNAAWLKEQANNFIIGDVNNIDDKDCYDMIFSTYVLEHIAEPSNHLSRLFELLHNGGSLFIFSPRYDFPGYLCPSSRHLKVMEKFKIFLAQQVCRIKSMAMKQPSFLIQSDLAAFHGPFFTDADAVHWVSLFDLRYWARGLNANFKKLKIGSPRFATRDWIVKRWLTCAVEIRKGV